uniref:Protein kinase domain-containing protein n=1 Tax=Saimiri boliviensis boliviensis TaxID=39432 RepID=A0A2K6T6Q2_SAIBB
TKVTTNVTSAVMGNPVAREFDVGDIASGGNGLAWKIFNDTRKPDQITDSLKQGVQQLTRRIQGLLGILYRQVFSILASVLVNWENLPSPLSPDIKDYKLHDVETKYGLLQISEGLSFLHSSVKMVNGNITPENVLNKSGACKIMGFLFFVSSTNPSEQELKFPYKQWDPSLHSLCLPNPEYLAPEYILSVSCDTASDMYSLGTFMYAVFNKGKPIFEVHKQDIYRSFSRQLDQLSHLGSNSLTNIPAEVREQVKLLLNVTPTVRPDTDQMTKIPFFDDVDAVTLLYFDTLFQRDNLQKSVFQRTAKGSTKTAQALSLCKEFCLV